MSDSIITGEARYDQGDQGGLMDVTLSVRNGTPGAEVEFHSTTPLPNGEYIRLPWTTVTNPTMRVGVTVEIPAGWQTVFVYSYNPVGLPIPPGFQLSLQVAYVVLEHQHEL